MRHLIKETILKPLGTSAVILLAVCAVVQAASPPPIKPSLREAVEGHLAAIARRDLGALLPTLTEGKELTMIGPDGRKWDTKEQYVEFHRGWFAAKDDGKLEPTIVRVIEAPALGHALIRYRYRSRAASGQTQTTVAWLALTFATEHGRWRLVFDQNTLIQEP
jgi:ketosteroid isomerase-like protein